MLLTIDERLEFEELGAYDSASDGVLVVRDPVPLGIAIDMIVVVVSARTSHSVMCVKTQTLIVFQKGKGWEGFLNLNKIENKSLFANCE